MKSLLAIAGNWLALIFFIALVVLAGGFALVLTAISLFAFVFGLAGWAIGSAILTFTDITRQRKKPVASLPTIEAHEVNIVKFERKTPK